MNRYFITSSGTGIGKTFVTAALTRYYREAGQPVRAVKPLISGFTQAAFAESDTAFLLNAMVVAATAEEIDRCSPWRFAAPLSPDMAAAREGKTIDFDAVVKWCRDVMAGPDETVLIEGVGGAMVPIDDRHTVLNWIEALGIPSILVVGSYLGTISHTLTALTALRNTTVRMVVVNESEVSPVPLADTAAAIRRFTATPVLTLPRNAVPADLADIVKVLTT